MMSESYFGRNSLNAVPFLPSLGHSPIDNIDEKSFYYWQQRVSSNANIVGESYGTCTFSADHVEPSHEDGNQETGNEDNQDAPTYESLLRNLNNLLSTLRNYLRRKLKNQRLLIFT